LSIKNEISLRDIDFNEQYDRLFFARVTGNNGFERDRQPQTERRRIAILPDPRHEFASAVDE
jgi:hypothetical protein